MYRRLRDRAARLLVVSAFVPLLVLALGRAAVAAEDSTLVRGPYLQLASPTSKAINAEIARSGASADLLYRRACEHRALRQYDLAEADLNAALKLDAAFTAVQLEPARILVRRGEAKRAAGGDRPAAEADLRAALSELQARLNPQRPDPTLVAERTVVCRLLGIVPPATAVDADD